jgi:hypothetical protein
MRGFPLVRFLVTRNLVLRAARIFVLSLATLVCQAQIVHASPHFDSDVKKFQIALRHLGYLSSEADGYFGEDTFVAIESYQSARGHLVNGELDNNEKIELLGVYQQVLTKEQNIGRLFLGALGGILKGQDDSTASAFADGFNGLFETSAVLSQLEAEDRIRVYEAIRDSIVQQAPIMVALSGGKGYTLAQPDVVSYRQDGTACSNVNIQIDVGERHDHTQKDLCVSPNGNLYADEV